GKKETRTTIYRVGLEIKKGNHYVLLLQVRLISIIFMVFQEYVNLYMCPKAIMKFLVQKIEECFTLRFVILNFSGIYSF
ncbi:hypothetical protein RhiirA5_367677, partial [Rhizophagus irregularis]